MGEGGQSPTHRLETILGFDVLWTRNYDLILFVAHPIVARWRRPCETTIDRCISLHVEEKTISKSKLAVNSHARYKTSSHIIAKISYRNTAYSSK